MLIFGVRRLLSLKNCQTRPQNGFLRFSLKIQLFSKKLWNKKISSIKFLIKKAIFNFGVRWPLTVSQWHRWTCCKQSKVRPLQPLLLRSEISFFWRTSCSRDFFFNDTKGENNVCLKTVEKRGRSSNKPILKTGSRIVGPSVGRGVDGDGRTSQHLKQKSQLCTCLPHEVI